MFLGILITFAQFEREIITERNRNMFLFIGIMTALECII